MIRRRSRKDALLWWGLAGIPGDRPAERHNALRGHPAPARGMFGKK
jgi:hypothetical protein